MLEDEIQYIGTRMPPTIIAPAPVRPFPSPQNPVTGVVLHVVGNGGQPACDMTFHRAQTSAVMIGRKSSSDHKFGRDDNGFGNAGLSCQVVSSRHAKLAFSDSGYVYLIDLSSRHGTHILHPGDTVSKMLDPEVVTMLSNGDIITFGKTVGKGSFMVPPVTARVELLFGNQSDISSITSTNTTTRPPVVIPESGPTSRKTSSGRYGLYVPSSLSSIDGSSDDDSSLRYDHDSDIEEINPPSSPDHVARLGHAFAPSLPVLPIIRGLQSHFYSELHNNSFPFGSSSMDGLRLPAIDRLPERSRSNSPMDLSSPTPTPIGAWPSLVPPSSSANNEQEPNSTDASDKSGHTEDGQADESAKSVGPVFSEVVSPQSGDAFEHAIPDIGEPSRHQSSESRSPSPPSELDLQGREKERELGLEMEKEQDIHDRMMLVSETISRMHHDAAAKRGSFKQHNDDKTPHGNEPSNLADRVSDAEILFSNLDDRLDVTEDHVSNLQEYVKKLQEQADALTPTFRESTADAVADIKAGVTALNALVKEMKALHEDMEVHNAVSLSARGAMAAINMEALVCHGETTMSQKRKRSELEEDEASSTFFDTVGVQATAMVNDTMERPSKKRVKRIISSVMHTAAAVTVGAVATWSALAFS